MLITARSVVVALALLVAMSPAEGQWTRVPDVPAIAMFSASANGDTIAAGADSTVFVSTDAGLTWRPSIRVAAGVTSVRAEWIRNGKLYAGTAGQGVFVGDDLGDTWLGFNQGLVGGLFNSQLFIIDMLARGDSLFVATSGAGVYMRRPRERSLAAFRRAVCSQTRPATWTASPPEARNCSPVLGSTARCLFGTPAMRTGHCPGSTMSASRPAWPPLGHLDGQRLGGRGQYRGVRQRARGGALDLRGLDLGTLSIASFVGRGHDLFAAFGTAATVIEHSVDDGATWQVLDSQSVVFVGGSP